MAIAVGQGQRLSLAVPAGVETALVTCVSGQVRVGDGRLEMTDATSGVTLNPGGSLVIDGATGVLGLVASSVTVQSLVSSGGGSFSGTPDDNSVTDAKVAVGAAIQESKLALASDAAAGVASRRTLGTGATQAAAGNHLHTGVYDPAGTGASQAASAVATHEADTTAVHGIVDMASVKQVRIYTGGAYPARGAFAQSVEWQGPTDPALQGGLSVANGDTWVPTA